MADHGKQDEVLQAVAERFKRRGAIAAIMAIVGAAIVVVTGSTLKSPPRPWHPFYGAFSLNHGEAFLLFTCLLFVLVMLLPESFDHDAF